MTDFLIREEAEIRGIFVEVGLTGLADFVVLVHGFAVLGEFDALGFVGVQLVVLLAFQAEF